MTPNISAETGMYLIRKHTATKETQLDVGLREEGLEQRDNGYGSPKMETQLQLKKAKNQAH